MYNSADVTWTLVAAFLVFFMQAGFALCEAGLTRAKNTGNILMKNMMDFCIGTPCYWLVGFGIMFAGSGALIGGFDPFIRGSYDFGTLPVWVYAVFQTVFCATAATIVSGSMAERTKFSAYCCYSAAISLIVYPISGHWIWGGGWLAQLGFHDFAGSCAIHMVGGISALIGAKLLGPRIGKFDKDKIGKIVKVNAFPGHNLPIGCLGVFILWLQRCCLYFRRAVRLRIPYHYRSSRSCNRSLHDFYLDQVWQTRCIYVPECIFGRSGSNYCSL